MRNNLPLQCIKLLLFFCIPFTGNAQTAADKTTQPAVLTTIDLSVKSTKAKDLTKATVITEINGVTAKDAGSIIQNCIDLPGLQKYLSVDRAANSSQLIVYYYNPILFPVDLTLTRNGKNVQFKQISMALNKIADDFILFKTFEVKEKSASVSYEYYYDHMVSQKVIQIKLDLQRVGNSWVISNTILKN